MRSFGLAALVPLALLAVHCSGANVPSADGEAEALSGGRINGGETGAMVRETTPAGFTQIAGTWTVPDYDPTQPGAPWVYYGFGDEAGIDMEIGWAFQHGDGSADKPHRWLPYMRRGKNFSFGDETTRALPNDTFVFAAWLDDAGVHATKDVATLIFHGSSGDLEAMPMPGLSAKSAHVRRVVGQAVSTTYHGERLGTLGPVTFAASTVTSAAGDTQRFHDVGVWKELRGGTLYGSVKYPAGGVGAHHAYDWDHDTDVISLFP